MDRLVRTALASVLSNVCKTRRSFIWCVMKERPSLSHSTARIHELIQTMCQASSFHGFTAHLASCRRGRACLVNIAVTISYLEISFPTLLRSDAQAECSSVVENYPVRSVRSWMMHTEHGSIRLSHPVLCSISFGCAYNMGMFHQSHFRRKAVADTWFHHQTQAPHGVIGEIETGEHLIAVQFL